MNSTSAQPFAANTPGCTPVLAGRVHHVAVQTTRMDSCVSWYQEFFGCRVNWTLKSFSELTLSRLPGITELTELVSGDIRFHVFTRNNGDCDRTSSNADQFQHVCLALASPESLKQMRSRWLELFSSNQYIFARPEVATQIEADADGIQNFYAFDLNGLEYEFAYFPDGSDESNRG